MKNQEDTTIRFIQLTEDLAIDDTDIRLPKGTVLPVEVPKGTKKLEAKHVTLPAMMSGMVQAIAEDHEESETYRRFLAAAWPELESDMTKTGIAKIHQKDPEGAFPFFYNAYKYAPQPNSCINLSNCYRAIAELAADNKEEEKETKSWVSARHTLLEGLDRFGENDAILKALGELESQMGNFEEALAYFERYLAIAEEGEEKARIKGISKKISSLLSSDKAFLEAYDAVMLGHYAEAIEKSTAFISDSPKVWNGYFLRGWAKRLSGDTQGARSDMLQCVSLGHADADVYTELSMIEYLDGSKDLSLTYLETAADLDPDSVSTMLNLANAYIEAGRFDEGREWIEKARYAKASPEHLEKVISFYEKMTGEKIGDEIIHEEIVESDDEEDAGEIADPAHHHDGCSCGHSHHGHDGCSCGHDHHEGCSCSHKEE